MIILRVESGGDRLKGGAARLDANIYPYNDRLWNNMYGIYGRGRVTQASILFSRNNNMKATSAWENTQKPLGYKI